ncbi:MAG: hypothetical protein KIH67_003640 [Candidatus Moranbacteria bacterium]|nr:hypothetical protein [Candidatus Moranbacteria bacterium]
MPTITFIAGPDQDSQGNLTPLGETQAEGFAKLAKKREDLYTVIMTGEKAHARRARDIIIQTLGLQSIGGSSPGQKVQPADSKGLDGSDYIPINFKTDLLSASERLGLAPLEAYCEFCSQALLYEGREGAKSIRRFTNAGNYVKHMLIIGRPIFINQLVLSFFGDGMPIKMREQIITDAPLEPMTGYRFDIVDERWGLPTSMEQVGWNELVGAS